MTELDVLVPTYARPAALAVTLATLAAQDFRDFRLVVSDQTEERPSWASAEVQAVVRVLRIRGHAVELLHHLPRRGMAEQRQFLLDRVRAPFALFLDDDLVLEPDLVGRLVRTLREEGCGFVGCGLIGLSFAHDVRPEQQAVEWWEGPVTPELVEPGTPAWERHHLHSAANLWHLASELGPRAVDRRYKVAWVGGCVLYDAEKLRDVGGFGFWRDLPPEHAGEDVLAQLRVMARHGGCGLFPSGAFHQELPTTLPSRPVDAPHVLPVVCRPREGVEPAP
ncbi:MAG: glycosyltransferase [Thermoleophilia bacterium]|nr:glycosyltransferase [Thermoleophilia bacterium]